MQQIAGTFLAYAGAGRLSGIMRLCNIIEREKMSVQQALAEMVAATDAWFDTQLRRDDLAGIAARSPLQLGIFDDILLDYQPGRTSVDVDLRFGFESGQRPRPTLHEHEVRDQIVPALARHVQSRLASLGESPLIDYHFTFRAEIATLEGLLLLTVVDHLDTARRAQLLEQIAAYIEQKLTHGTQPTEELDTFFLARHLLDPGLFPAPDASWTIAQFQRIEELNKSRPKALAEHRASLIRRGVEWVEKVFLPQYFTVRQPPYGASEYTQKPGASLAPPDPGAGQADLMLYVAVMVLRHEPSYGKAAGRQFLELARLLGSRRAAQMMEEGSGSYAPEDSRLANAQLSLAANDVFALVDIVIREEGAEAYALALRQLIRLLQLGFPKSYKIRLKSGARQFLPVKGLARSDTQRFFANALAYPELHPLLGDYARAAMAEYEFYADVDNEKNCMPGSYATIGLALASPAYFTLLQTYMGLVDEEHQSVQDQMTAALVQQYGVSARLLPTLLACLLKCTDDARLKLAAFFEDDALLAQLVTLCAGLQPYEVEHVLYLIWGKADKLAALARKAGGARQQQLQTLLARAG